MSNQLPAVVRQNVFAPLGDRHLVPTLIATLTYGFARIRTALQMKVEDLRPRGAAWALR